MVIMAIGRVVAHFEFSQRFRKWSGVDWTIDAKLSFIIPSECIHSALCCDHQTMVVATSSLYYFLMLQCCYIFRQKSGSHIRVPKLSIVIESCAEELTTAKYEESVVEPTCYFTDMSCHKRRLFDWSEDKLVTGAS